MWKLEDRARCTPNLVPDIPDVRVDLYAVYDGHEGSYAADYIAGSFHSNLRKHIQAMYRYAR